MKAFASILFALTLGLYITACGNSGSEAHSHEGHDHDTNTEAAAAPHGEGPEYTSAYVCPMHCQGSGSDQPGKCPVCGMDYVAQADHAQDGHNH